jgi:hypothetical protein
MGYNNQILKDVQDKDQSQQFGVDYHLSEV